MFYISYTSRHIGLCVNTTLINKYLRQLTQKTSNATLETTSSCNLVGGLTV